MLACILFVFGALIVYAAILNQKLLMSDDRKSAKKKRRSKNFDDSPCLAEHKPEEAVLMTFQNGNNMVKERSSSTTSLHYNEKIEKKTKPNFTTWNYKHSAVDRFFLVLAPILFLIFNAIYWSYFYAWDKFVNPHFPTED